jgi:hypothetical protein
MFAAFDELFRRQSPRGVVRATQSASAFLGDRCGETSRTLLKVVVPPVANVAIIL